MSVLNAALAALSGLLVGGFINFCVFRIISGEKAESACQSKNGSTQSRRKKLLCFSSAGLITAAVFLLYYWRISLSPWLFIELISSSLLIAIAFIDLECRVIYVWMNLALLFTGILACFVCPLPHWFDRPIGLLIAALPLLLISAVSHGGMGLGDVELAAAGGFLLGWRLSLISLLISSIAFASFGLIWILIKRSGLKTVLPFGPFLALGFIAASFLS